MIHLRSERKPLEHRSALTPSTAKALLDHGFSVLIERSPARIFDDEEFSKVGATLVDEGSWVDADKDTIILGLKEHPTEDVFPLTHTHIQFAHCFKNQDGWREVLGRWVKGEGTLLDLEFLPDEAGRRVAAFGYHAGFAGAALGIDAWARQALGLNMEPVRPFPNEKALVDHIRGVVDEALSQGASPPRALVIGALGRCGKGAVDMCEKAGLTEILRWDMQETAKGGPFPEILSSEIFINCIYLNTEIPPFIDPASLDSAERRLAIVVDVSCDTTNPHNPIPIYSVNTTFEHPAVNVPTKIGPPLAVISIDHLPTLLPREASEAFSHDLLPSLLQLDHWRDARVWKDALELFHKKSAEI